MQEWHKFWFYVFGIGNDLAALINEPPKCQGSWAPIDKPSGNAQQLIEVEARLKGRGLLGVHIRRAWVERRVLPLATRASPMYAYMGREDPARVSVDELSLDEVLRRISVLTGLETKKIPIEVVVEAFHAGNPPSDESRFYFSLLEFLLPFPDSFSLEGVCDLWGFPVGAVARPGSGPGDGEAAGAGAGRSPHSPSGSFQEEGRALC